MKNWTQRLAVFAVLGAVLSSAMLVGCGSGGDDAENTTTNTTTTTSKESGE